MADLSVFRENAAHFVKAGLKKTLRMGVANVDYTKIEILTKPISMVPFLNSIEKGCVTLEIKFGNGPWKAVNIPRVMRDGLYKWTQPNVIPCNKHAIRLWVYAKEGSQIRFLFPNSIKAASRSSLISSGYQPEKSKQLEIVRHCIP